MILGFMLSPVNTFACNNHNTVRYKHKSCGIGGNETIKKCCNTKATHSHNCNNHKHGKCGGACCQCITSGMFKFLPLVVSVPQTFLLLPDAKKERFSYSELFVNADSKGLRLPPKIS
ncbi:hypothetical protein AM493_04640 [Flavobacterium akiainvivens]|uniref:Uncharacterized protein n=2 Tax=Flavobacterium akiainvivens TaxID=1202724 RepID=A0A0M9VHC6_9FLAO|nr:hypothetical protein AM493_04640 [Flavobacterium akiainvivens]